MEARQEMLIKFYLQCRDKGYTDMSDATQSLKAKVIASDLGLGYKKIDAVFAEAKALYEQTEEQKIRHAVNGELICTLEGAENESLRIYRRPDDSVYCCEGKSDTKIENVIITIMKGGIISYNYHPSKLIYTGASSGGISMGGFHQTEAYYTEGFSASDKATLIAKYGEDKQFSVRYATLAAPVKDAFKRDGILRKYGFGKIRCYDNSHDMFGDARMQVLANKSNVYERMEAMSVMAEQDRLPAQTCLEIADLLNRAIHHHYPPTVEELYQEASRLSAIDDTQSQKNAWEIYALIPEYEDAKEKGQIARNRYEELNQNDKENAILQKEANSKKRKVIAVIAAVTVALTIAGGVYYAKVITPRNKYNQAIRLMENGHYEAASQAFQRLGTYSDASVRISEPYYREVLSLIEAGENSVTIPSYLSGFAGYLSNRFERAGDYENMPDNMKDLYYQQGLSYLNSQKYDKAYYIFRLIADYSDVRQLAKGNQGLRDYISNKAFVVGNRRLRIGQKKGLYKYNYLYWDVVTKEDERYLLVSYESMASSPVVPQMGYVTNGIIDLDPSKLFLLSEEELLRYYGELPSGFAGCWTREGKVIYKKEKGSTWIGEPNNASYSMRPAMWIDPTLDDLDWLTIEPN